MRLVAVILFAMSMTLAAIAAPPTAPAATRPTAEFPVAGVAIDVPPRWQAMPETNILQVARYGMPAADGSTVAGAIFIIEAAPRSGSTLDQYAAKLALALHGQRGAPTTLGGSPAAVVVFDKDDTAKLKRNKMVIAEHGGLFYYLADYQGEGKPGAADVEAVRKSWRWIETDEPAKHLEFRRQAVMVLDTLLISQPRLLRADQARPAKDGYRAGLFDFLHSREAVSLTIQLGNKNPDVAMVTAAESLGRDVQREWHLKEPLVW